MHSLAWDGTKGALPGRTYAHSCFCLRHLGADELVWHRRTGSLRLRRGVPSPLEYGWGW
jgi:hypothetical protein